MAHIYTTESYLKKVCRIARELDISIEEASLTCDAFELAFSDQETRRAIFGMIEKLDESAARKGEPRGLIITYAVEVGIDGIHVGRYADYIPPGQVVELTPANRAMIYLKITDDFPTQELLGPMLVNRPCSESVVKAAPGPASESVPEVSRDPRFESVPGAARGPLTGNPDGVQVATGVVSTEEFSEGKSDSSQDIELPSLAKEGCPVGRGGLTRDSVDDCSETETRTDLPSHRPRTAIPLGPVRLKFNERFPFVSQRRSTPHRPGRSCSNPVSTVTRHSSLVTSDPPPVTTRPARVTCHVLPAVSGLSPPLTFGDMGHSETNDVPPATIVH